MTMRETTVITIAKSFGENLVSFIVGLLFIGGGAWVVNYALSAEPHSDKLVYIGIALAVGGAAMMPSILPKMKQIIVIVQAFPVIGPMLGGRRSTDPQPPAAP